MRQKLLACAVLIFSVVIAGCSKDEADSDTDTIWVGEVYAESGSGSATVLGEFGSYDECVEKALKESGSGVFNCGVKLP